MRIRVQMAQGRRRRGRWSEVARAPRARQVASTYLPITISRISRPIMRNVIETGGTDAGEKRSTSSPQPLIGMTRWRFPTSPCVRKGRSSTVFWKTRCRLDPGHPHVSVQHRSKGKSAQPRTVA